MIWKSVATPSNPSWPPSMPITLAMAARRLPSSELGTTRRRCDLCASCYSKYDGDDLGFTPEIQGKRAFSHAAVSFYSFSYIRSRVTLDSVSSCHGSARSPYAPEVVPIPSSLGEGSGHYHGRSSEHICELLSLVPLSAGCNETGLGSFRSSSHNIFLWQYCSDSRRHLVAYDFRGVSFSIQTTSLWVR